MALAQLVSLAYGVSVEWAASNRASALHLQVRDHLGLAVGPSGSLRRGSERSRRYMIWLYS